MRRFYVGLDVHSRRSAFVVQTENGELVGRGQVPTTLQGFRKFSEDYHLPEGTPIALETGTIAFHVAHELTALRLEPVVIDAHEVRLKAHRPLQKSDRQDAFELCEGIRRGIYRTIVHVPDDRIRALRESLSRRRHFVRLMTAEIIAAKRLLRGVGQASLARSLRTESAWEKLIASLRGGDDLRHHVERHKAIWICAREQVLALDRDLAAMEEAFAEDARRLQSVPGVGPIVALTVLAFFSDASRFPSAKHAASYAGLVPSTQQSGDRDVHGRITKRGSAELRAMLCEAAHHARRPNHPLNPYFSKLCARRGCKMAIVGVAHRLCRILFAMLRHQTDFDINRLGVELGPFERKSLRLYRLKPALAGS